LPEPAEIAKPTMITIHHTATPNDPLSSDWHRVRSIWYYHTMTHGWGDIGYHFLIDPNGVIYLGDSMAYATTALSLMGRTYWATTAPTLASQC
jgi:hypothetical protein